MDLLTKMDYEALEDREIKYFKETTVFGKIEAEKENLSIDGLVATSIDVSLDDVELVETSSLISNEGQKLSGKILLISYDIIVSLKYRKSCTINLLYKTYVERGNSCYIVVPEEISNITIERIVSNKFYSLGVLVENIDIEITNISEIEYAITLLFVFNPLKIG